VQPSRLLGEAAAIPTDDAAMAYRTPFDDYSYFFLTVNSFDSAMSNSKEIGPR
jgi:hypothetical protein